MAQWHFIRHPPAHIFRNSTAAEFFAVESIGEAAEPLVREGIQNSLDARAGGPSPLPLRVRISVSGASGAALAEDVAPFFGEKLWRHVGGPGNGPNRPPERDERCPCLVSAVWR